MHVLLHRLCEQEACVEQCSKCRNRLHGRHAYCACQGHREPLAVPGLTAALRPDATCHECNEELNEDGGGGVVGGPPAVWNLGGGTCMRVFGSEVLLLGAGRSGSDWCWCTDAGTCPRPPFLGSSTPGGLSHAFGGAWRVRSGSSVAAEVLQCWKMGQL